MIRYLGRQRQIPDEDETPICQLVSITQLQRNQRCQFCRYYERNRSISEVYECEERNMCGHESNLYTPMANGQFFRSWSSNDYTPVRLFRQRVIENETRYVQFISCDFSGYQCNHLCQFYPARIADSKTIAACASTNKCGRNASFFDLLQIADSYFKQFPDANRAGLTHAQLMLLSGDIIEITSITSWSVDDHQRVICEVNGFGWLPLMDWRPNSVTAGNMLLQHRNVTAFFGFTDTTISSYNLPENVILLQDTISDFWNTLNSWLGDPFISNKPLRYLQGFTWPTGDTWLIYLSSETCVRLAAAYKFILSFQPPQTPYRYIIKLGATSNYCLAQPYPDSEPSKWSRVKFDGDFGSLYTIVRITSYNDPLANWLRNIGVSETFFINLQ